MSVADIPIDMSKYTFGQDGLKWCVKVSGTTSFCSPPYDKEYKMKMWIVVRAVLIETDVFVFRYQEKYKDAPSTATVQAAVDSMFSQLVLPLAKLQLCYLWSEDNLRLLIWDQKPLTDGQIATLRNSLMKAAAACSPPPTPPPYVSGLTWLWILLTLFFVGLGVASYVVYYKKKRGGG